MSGSSGRFTLKSLVGFGRALGAASLLVAMTHTSVWAQAGQVDVTVTALPPAVSLSTDALTTRAAYRVTLTNLTSNVLNNVSLRGSAAVVGAEASAPFVEAVAGTPNPCAVDPADAAAVICNFGRLTGAGSTGSALSIIAVFQAPNAGDSITFTAVATFKEGSNDQPGNPPGNDTVIKTASTDLDADVPLDQAKTFILSTGGDVFTGPTRAATPTDAWVIVTTVPAKSTGATAALFEVPTGSCSANLPVCSSSDIDVRNPGATTPAQFAGPYLLMTVLVDASIIPSNAKIGTVIAYHASRLADGTLGPAKKVEKCANLAGTPPAGETICLIEAKAFGKGNSVPAAFKGDWGFYFSGTENGRISLQ